MAHKLLLADDSAAIRRVIKLTFAEEDVDVVAVVDGAQAIEAIAREAPDIVLADASLPGTDGYDVASFIRNEAALARIPVVLLTGAFEPLDESRAASCGCRAVLVKPFAPRQVIDTVRELLGPAAGSATAATPSASAPVERDDAAGAPAESAPVERDDTAGAVVERDAPAGAPAESAPVERDDTAGAVVERDAPAGAPAESAPVERDEVAGAPGDVAEPAGEPAPAGVPDSAAQATGSGGAVLARAFAAFLAAEQGAPPPESRAAPPPGGAGGAGARRPGDGPRSPA